MQSQVKTYSHQNGEIQRVQTVRLENWDELDFLRLSYEAPALEGFADIYEKYLVPAAPWLFGQMILFRLPETVKLPMESKKYGCIADNLTAAAMLLEKGVKMVAGKPVFLNDAAGALYRKLETAGCLRVVRGKLPVTTIIPVGNLPGYLSHAEPDARLKINSHFFIMDRFDCATVFDHIGTPLGLCVKDGVVTNPPLYGREALLVYRDGSVTVRPLELDELGIEIDGKRITGPIYTRPRYARTPNDRTRKAVIVGCKVVAVKEGGSMVVPASGFVMSVDDPSVKPGDAVIYRGLENVTFGLQIGNSILKNGVKTKEFLSRFYNIRRLEPVAYPPSLYPMDFQNARAARTAIGADAAGKPVLLWAEGRGKLRYEPGKDSRGATLPEMADFCSDAGMIHAVNMDGGGSAQILLHGRRQLHISDRNPDNSSAERAIPMALIVR